MKRILLITFISVVLAACAPKQHTADKEKTPPVMIEANLRVEGMTCTDCEQSIAKGVNELAGIDSISANHLDSTAFVRYDSTRTNLKEIAAAIAKRGFKVK
jgi:copper chaperone CopZ